MALPQTVNPGQLITAELINDILAALRGHQNIHSNFSSDINGLKQVVSDLDERITSIEDLLNKTRLRDNENGAVIDRQSLEPQIPDIGDRFEQIEQRMNEVELRVVRDSDPIERLPGMTPENVNLLNSHQIKNVSDLKANFEKIPDIISNATDAVQMSIMIERMR